MDASCDCGMMLEVHATRTGCQECGTPCCRSCAVEVHANTYCRWCATSLARAA